MKIILIVFIVVLGLFAIQREYKDQPNCYLEAIPEKTDTRSALYKKLELCLVADSKTVKWRRSLISSIVFLGLSIVLIHEKRLPSYKEIFLSLVLLYFVYYLMWNNYTETITQKVSKIGKNIILKLKKLDK
jgi:hypothetical protein